MQFVKSTPLEGWRTSSERRGLNVLIAIAAVGGLFASGALVMAEDPRPLDRQVNGAMRESGNALAAWKQLLSRGLQVSLRAVADGRDDPAVSPPQVAIATPAASLPAPTQAPH
jgi:hypothetical protein